MKLIFLSYLYTINILVSNCEGFLQRQQWTHCSKYQVLLSVKPSSENIKRVLVVGGSGRVGGSTIRALKKFYSSDLKNIGLDDKTAKLELFVGGRSESHFHAAIKRWKKLEPGQSYDDVKFKSLDITNHESLTAAMAGCNLVIHTAGPFQGKTAADVLSTAIEVGAHYVDVCDDSQVAQTAKNLTSKAKHAKVSAVISAGIWPGVDQLMAVSCCESLGGSLNARSIEFSAFTAGTGNAGTTILSATFLILAEKALAFKNALPIYYPSASDFKKVYFGGKLGLKTVFRMNLIESFTCNHVLGIPNIDTFFGTAPEIWNYLLAAMTYVPQSVLRNRDLMQIFAKFSEPLVRITDKLVGSANAMKVTVVGYTGEKVEMIYAHSDLEECVGIATAAFGAAVLRGDVENGVWYPEEAFSQDVARNKLLEEATRGNFLWQKIIAAE